MDLNSIISSLTGNNLIGEIAKKFNIDPNKIIEVIKAAIPKFLSSMQKNAGTAAGAAALTQETSPPNTVDRTTEVSVPLFIVSPFS